MRLDELETFDKVRDKMSRFSADRARKAGSAQTDSTVAKLLQLWSREVGQRNIDVNNPDEFLNGINAFLVGQGFDQDMVDDATDLAIEKVNAESPDMENISALIIRKAAQQGNQYRGDVKIPPDIIDAIKKLDMEQRQLLAQVLLGQTRVR